MLKEWGFRDFVRTKVTCAKDRGTVNGASSRWPGVSPWQERVCVCECTREKCVCVRERWKIAAEEKKLELYSETETRKEEKTTWNETGVEREADRKEVSTRNNKCIASKQFAANAHSLLSIFEFLIPFLPLKKIRSKLIPKHNRSDLKT